MDRNINRNEILKILKNFYKANNLNFPDGIGIYAEKREHGMIDCKISLATSCAKETNMQIDCNAFDGWSIVVYTALKNQYEKVTVKLCLNPNTDSERKLNIGQDFYIEQNVFLNSTVGLD